MYTIHRAEVLLIIGTEGALRRPQTNDNHTIPSIYRRSQSLYETGADVPES